MNTQLHPLLPNGAPIPVHPGSVLYPLTADERETLYDWLETMSTPQVREKLADPRPEGFGIKAQLTTLRRFHARARSHLHLQLAQDTAEEAEAIAPGGGPSFDCIQRVASRVALELMLLHPNRLEAFKHVSRYVIDQKKLTLKAQDHDLRLRRFDLDEQKHGLQERIALVRYGIPTTPPPIVPKDPHNPTDAEFDALLQEGLHTIEEMLAHRQPTTTPRTHPTESSTEQPRVERGSRRAEANGNPPVEQASRSASLANGNPPVERGSCRAFESNPPSATPPAPTDPSLTGNIPQSPGVGTPRSHIPNAHTAHTPTLKEPLKPISERQPAPSASALPPARHHLHHAPPETIRPRLHLPHPQFHRRPPIPVPGKLSRGACCSRRRFVKLMAVACSGARALEHLNFLGER